MKIVTAIDSFKGSMTSLEAGTAVAEGIRRTDGTAEVIVRPLADGGEGTVDALISGMGGKRQVVTVTGPMGAPTRCAYGIIPAGGAGSGATGRPVDGAENDPAGGAKTAVIEMAAAAGITLVQKESRNPLYATTYGVGEMIRDAIQKGCRRFIVGIGGSATNDGGIGMLLALGYRFLDKDKAPVPFGTRGLETLETIDDADVLPELSACEFRIACDVTNPLCGANGASAVYGPQKGADPAMVAQMDAWLARYAALTRKKFPKADPQTPGSGAAGGLGFAFLSYTHATLESGIRIVLEETHLEDYIREADLVITGEGRMDGQTAMGKAPVGVAHLAKKYGKPVVAFAGSVARDARACNARGIDAIFPALREICTLEEAMKTETAMQNLADSAEQAYRLFLAGRDGRSRP